MPMNYHKMIITFGTIMGCLVMALLTSCSMMSEMSAMRGYAAVSGPEFEPYHGLKRRIAVLQFDDQTDLGAGKAGSAVTDMIMGVLARSGRFVVVERSELNVVLGEQALGQSGAMTLESAITAGRLGGVQALILGRVEELEHEYHRRDLESEEKDWGIALMGSFGLAELYCRVVDVASGEILFSERYRNASAPWFWPKDGRF